eukprot:TRINITY_DN76497_c0_g1_i1.p1 TRINITY_DN76497_c0_g1~~TRINITY_DN76497_c0_g1_i1.p1  ORF type:complete len:181 (+),score=19.04 TRINITY_DN76497_c0_g1_i1:84-626(+)
MEDSALVMTVSRSANDATTLPLKNTFVHFDETDGTGSPTALPPRGQVSCPAIVQRHAFRTKTSILLEEHLQRKLTLHLQKECRPCAYFAFKSDGCRQGDSCEYCHLCTRSEIRRWKRAKGKYASRSPGSNAEIDDTDNSSSDDPDSEPVSSLPSLLGHNGERLVFRHPAKLLMGLMRAER